MDTSPASAKQLALFAYLGVAVLDNLTSSQASELLEKIQNEPAYRSRLAKWEVERLTLHPDLFYKEAQAAGRAPMQKIDPRQDYRPQYFFRELHNCGARIFTRVNRTKCADVVWMLDQQYPNWIDATEEEQLQQFFLPAYAQLYPDDVREEYRGHWGEATEAPLK